MSTWERCYNFKNIFAEKISENIGVFFIKLLLVFAKIVIITLVFEKNANFFAKNWHKSQKIVITTSTRGNDVIIFKNKFTKNGRKIFSV
jgi:hypothetical protein